MFKNLNKIRACACIITIFAINTTYAGYQTASSANATYVTPADQMHSDRSTTYYANPTDRNLDASMTTKDLELTKRIRDKISSSMFTKGYDHVNVRVNNGVVTLIGFVKTQDEKEKLDKEVRNIEGVQNLTSEVLVQDSNIEKDKSSDKFAHDTFSTPADEQLNKKIRDNVSRGWLWDSYKEVRLNTNSGVVTLEGVVENASDQQKLMNEVQKIEGVKSVINHLRLNK